VIGGQYVSYIAAVKLAGQHQQLVGKNFKHCLICSPGLRVEGGSFRTPTRNTWEVTYYML
jgi:hypothetical protein